MISIHFVKGKLKGRNYCLDFAYIDGSEHHFNICNKLGVCCGGIYIRYYPLRFVDISVVRQHCFYKTLVLLIHEILHGLIWLFALPKSWNKFIDRKILAK